MRFSHLKVTGAPRMLTHIRIIARAAILWLLSGPAVAGQWDDRLEAVG